MYISPWLHHHGYINITMSISTIRFIQMMCWTNTSTSVWKKNCNPMSIFTSQGHVTVKVNVLNWNRNCIMFGQFHCFKDYMYMHVCTLPKVWWQASHPSVYFIPQHDINMYMYMYMLLPNFHNMKSAYPKAFWIACMLQGTYMYMYHNACANSVDIWEKWKHTHVHVHVAILWHRHP